MMTYDLTTYNITGGGVSDYNELENKPQINGITLIGDLDASALKLVDVSTFNDNAEVVSAAINQLIRGKADASAAATKEYVDGSLALKQNVLTAGTGIAINNNTISCTLEPNFVVICQTLPATGQPNKIYLVPAQDGSTGNLYIEYLWVNNAWEEFGKINPGVDLSAYLTKVQAAQLYVDVSTFNDNNEVVSAAVNGLIRDKANLTDISAFITANDVSVFTTKEYVDGSINGVKALIPDVSAFITANDVSIYATKTYVDGTFTDISTFNTNNEVVSAAINGLIRDKANLTDISAFITANDVSIYATKTYVDSSLATKVGSDTIVVLWTGTQAEYDALGSYSDNTVYIIK